MLTITGLETVEFNFKASKTSKQTTQVQLQTPSGTSNADLVLKAFDVSYTNDEEYGFGELQINVEALSIQTAACTVTLRDDNTDKREWSGTVTAVALFYN